MVKKKGKKEPECKLCKPCGEFTEVAIVALFIILLLALNSAAVGNNLGHEKSITGYSTLGEGWNALWDSWGQGALDIIVARYMFFALGIILLFSLAKVILPGLNSVFHFLIGLIFSFLFTGYILPGELLAVMAAYSAAGITLIAVVPFFILVSLTASMLTKANIGPAQAILERFVWIFFFIFLIYKAFTGLTSGAVVASSFVMWLMVGVALLSFLIFWRHEGYLKMVGNTLKGAFGTTVGYMANQRRGRIVAQERHATGQALSTMLGEEYDVSSARKIQKDVDKIFKR